MTACTCGFGVMYALCVNCYSHVSVFTAVLRSLIIFVFILPRICSLGRRQSWKGQRQSQDKGCFSLSKGWSPGKCISLIACRVSITNGHRVRLHAIVTYSHAHLSHVHVVPVSTRAPALKYLSTIVLLKLPKGQIR